MKRNYMSIIFIVFIIGLLSGILIKDYYKQEYLYINKDKLIKKEIKSTQKNISKKGICICSMTLSIQVKRLMNVFII